MIDALRDLVPLEQYTDLQFQFRSLSYPLFRSCCYETETFRVNVCFGLSEHSVLIADGNNKVTSQGFQTTLLLYIFTLVLYFGQAAISNQII